MKNYEVTYICESVVPTPLANGEGYKNCTLLRLNTKKSRTDSAESH